MTTEMEKAVLCYVDGAFAYFTTAPLARQWGDDWDDAPYEYNASPPYSPHDPDGEQWRIYKVAFDGDLLMPSDDGVNSRWSVQQINAGVVPWLRTPSWSRVQFSIMAGATIGEFIAKVHDSGGEVFLPIESAKSVPHASASSLTQTADPQDSQELIDLRAQLRAQAEEIQRLQKTIGDDDEYEAVCAINRHLQAELTRLQGYVQHKADCELHPDWRHGETPYRFTKQLEPTRIVVEWYAHRCGLQGFDGMAGDVCEGCTKAPIERPAACTCGLTPKEAR